MRCALALGRNYSPKQSNAPPERAPLLPPFVSWCKGVGIKSMGVEISSFEEFGGGLGLRATELLPEGALLVAVPRKAMLSSESARVSAAFRPVLGFGGIWDLDRTNGRFVS